MCLSYVDEIPQKHRARRRWKLFSQDEDGILYSFYFSTYADPNRLIKKPIPVGVWLNEKDFRPHRSDHILSDIGVRYEVGWHCYEERPFTAEMSNIREVHCRKIVATGKQGRRDVTVAKYMMVLPFKEAVGNGN